MGHKSRVAQATVLQDNQINVPINKDEDAKKNERQREGRSMRLLMGQNKDKLQLPSPPPLLTPSLTTGPAAFVRLAPAAPSRCGRCEIWKEAALTLPKMCASGSLVCCRRCNMTHCCSITWSIISSSSGSNISGQVICGCLLAKMKPANLLLISQIAR